MSASGGLHHIVHVVRDLDAAAAFYRRAGFTLGTRNRHPWGTHNFVVQFAGFYIELLSVAEPENLGVDGLSLHFGAFNRDLVARREGFSMLLRQSFDIDADAAAFAQAGIGSSPALSFSREARLADGTTATLGFSLAFVRAPASPDAGFAVCQEHNAALFWNEALQRHDNGATGLASVVAVAADPARYAGFLTAYTGGEGVQQTASGIAVVTPRGRIDIMTAIGFSERYGVSVPLAADGLRLVALRLTARDLATATQVLERGHVDGQRSVDRLVIAPDQAFGACLIFET